MKHLSRMITAHNCFCSFLCNLASLVLIPAYFIPLAVILMHIDCYISMVVMMTSLLTYVVALDYFSFKGITAKGFFLGMIKNSPYAADYLKDAILADLIKRFIQTAVIPTISVIIAALISVKGIDLKFLVFALTLIFLNYAVMTCILALMRNITTLTPYACITIFFLVLLGALNTGMMFLFVYISTHIPFIIWLPISVITSVMISIYVFRYTTGRCLANIQGDLT